MANERELIQLELFKLQRAVDRLVQDAASLTDDVDVIRMEVLATRVMSTLRTSLGVLEDRFNDAYAAGEL